MKIISHKGYFIKAIKQCIKIFESLVNNILKLIRSVQTSSKEVFCGKS